MNDSTMSLLHTSVADARSSLECLLTNNPGQAAEDALQLLRYLEGMPDRSSLRRVAATVLRKAAVRLEVAS